MDCQPACVVLYANAIGRSRGMPSRKMNILKHAHSEKES